MTGVQTCALPIYGKFLIIIVIVNSVQGSAGYGLVPDFQGLRKYTMEHGNFDLNYIYV